MVKSKEGIAMPVPCTLPFIRTSVSVSGFQEVGIFMARFLHHDLSWSDRRIHGCILAVFWSLGILCGIWTQFYADFYSASLMRSTLSGSVSIVSLLCVTVLPFLISAFAVFLSCHWMLHPIAFCRGFLLSFVSLGITASFGSAGWLFRLLLCFSEFVSTPFLYWFWLRCFRGPGDSFVLTCALMASFCLLTGSIDYCLITPFLGDLIIF